MANEKINILLEAQDKASAPLKNVRGEIDKVGASAKRTASQAKGVQDGISGVGRGAGMAGIQVQQFVGQLQGGVNPMVALSQQSADLGFALGVPLLGAFVSIAAVIAGTFLPSLLETKKAFAELRKEAESVGIVLTALPMSVTQDQLLTVAEQAGTAATKFNAIQNRLRDLQHELLVANSGGSDFAETELLVARNAEVVEAEIARVNKELDVAGLELEIANRRTQEFSDALYGQYIRAGEAKNAITNYYQGIKAANSTDVDHLATLRKKADVLKAQLDPMIAYNQQVQEYERMAANQLITDEQLAQAKSKLRERLLGVKESLDITLMTMKDAKRMGIQSLEDGLVDLMRGAKSTKEAFRDMAQSVIASLIRMQIQQSITAPLAKAMGLSVGTRAMGGPVTAGKPYLVGERGPELIVPSSSGTVVPNNRLSGGSSAVNITLNVSTGVSDTVRAELQSMLPRIAEVTKAAVVDARRRGGAFATAFGA